MDHARPLPPHPARPLASVAGFVVRACLTLVLLLSAWACAGSPEADDSLRRIKEAGVLRWGADVQGGAPYIYADPDHPEKLRGFEVDLAAVLVRARQANLPVAVFE